MKKRFSTLILIGLITLLSAQPLLAKSSIPETQLSKGPLQLKSGFWGPKYYFQNDQVPHSIFLGNGGNYSEVVSVVPEALVELKKAESAFGTSMLLAIVSGTLLGLGLSSEEGMILTAAGLLTLGIGLSLDYESGVYLRRSVKIYNKDVFGE